jgi:hypothetical protein
MTEVLPMMYDITVTIHNSPNRIRGWGYLIEADTKEEAVEDALEFAQAKANRKYSRFKQCTFTVEEKNVRERPNW